MAMVLGVGTLRGYTNRGYTTLCMKRLRYELLKEGKSLCLFYDNPAAGNKKRNIITRTTGVRYSLLRPNDLRQGLFDSNPQCH